jgi:hypothetical protein
MGRFPPPRKATMQPEIDGCNHSYTHRCNDRETDRRMRDLDCIFTCDRYGHVYIVDARSSGRLFSRNRGLSWSRRLNDPMRIVRLAPTLIAALADRLRVRDLRKAAR